MILSIWHHFIFEVRKKKMKEIIATIGATPSKYEKEVEVHRAMSTNLIRKRSKNRVLWERLPKKKLLKL